MRGMTTAPPRLIYTHLPPHRIQSSALDDDGVVEMAFELAGILLCLVDVYGRVSY